jgi:circadian clock protein KaiB
MTDFFKGIALFTPGGDVVYCLDPTKRNHWHLHLCLKLQEILKLPETPHFLVPHYTATVDKCWNSQTKQIKIWAEIYPAVQRHQHFLEAVFGLYDLDWVVVSGKGELPSLLLVDSYRADFPQLWESNDLVVSYDWSPPVRNHSNYNLMLFVAGPNANTSQTLRIIHELLERNLSSKYTLKIVDIYKHPEQAEEYHISATPTLIRTWPKPIRKLVGTFEDTDKVLNVILD